MKDKLSKKFEILIDRINQVQNSLEDLYKTLRQTRDLLLSEELDPSHKDILLKDKPNV